MVLKDFVVQKFNFLELYLSKKFKLHEDNFKKLDEYINKKFNSFNRTINIIDNKIGSQNNKFQSSLNQSEERSNINMKGHSDLLDKVNAKFVQLEEQIENAKGFCEKNQFSITVLDAKIQID